MNPDEVIAYLGKHSQALLLYLEHLVLERKIQVKKFAFIWGYSLQEDGKNSCLYKKREQRFDYLKSTVFGS